MLDFGFVEFIPSSIEPLAKVCRMLVFAPFQFMNGAEKGEFDCFERGVREG